MSRLQLLQTGQSDEWLAVLARTLRHDAYHLPAYHALAEQQGEGTAYLLAYSEREYTIALPLLVRPLEGVPGLERAGEGWRDGTSVYGYAGPLASHADVPPAVAANFQAALLEALRELRVVSVFSRLHPFIPQSALLAGLGELSLTGRKVSIDLTLPPDVQRARYRDNHKRDINKLKRLGLCCVLDSEGEHLPVFIDIYHETMHRVNAASSYFFDADYFNGLVSALGPHARLFLCLHEGEIIAGGIFLVCDGIVQYHLGGTKDKYLELAPMKLVFDTVRLWATEQGLEVFHLGGGVGGQEDSLYRFKTGFSDRAHDFLTWRWTVVPDVYKHLQVEKVAWNNRNGLVEATDGYFPAYRCPTVPAQRYIAREEA
ncbi:MAG: GNAT family N-acetyltransferase [Chloroflexota bacterium]|nr:GNAT family N-acetyltransferase [Chloroflexota bacterium]